MAKTGQLKNSIVDEERKFFLQSLKVERGAVIFRLAVNAFGVIMVFLFGRDADPNAIRLIYLFCAVGFIGALLVAFFVYRKNVNQKWLRIMQYISTTFEVSVITALLWALGAHNTFKSPIFHVYYITVGLATFRYSRSLTVYTGLLAFSQYISLFIYYLATDLIVLGTFTEEYQGPVVSVINVIFKASFLFSMSMLLSSTAKGYARAINKVRIEEREVEQEKNRSLNLRNVLRRYFTKDVAEYIIKSGDNLAGEKREVSVLFCDFRDFTKLSETLSTEQVFTTLNYYLTKMADIVFEHGGTLDKYTGDGFMAVFGAPLQKEGDTLNAARTAIKIRKEIAAINQTHEADIGKDIQIGIGISTGEAVAGNVGSKERMDYTVIGGVVNLASRIERLNRQLGTTVLISEHTYNKIRNVVNANRIGRYRIRGLEKPVIIYEMLDIISDANAA